MERIERDTLDAVRKVLAGRGSGQIPLEARFVPSDNPAADGEVVLFSKANGHPHLVRVSVGAVSLGIATAIYESKHVHGCVASERAAVRVGRPHAEPGPAFASELRMALTLAGDNLEPAAGPGFANRPHADIVIEQSVYAAAIYNAERDHDEHVRIALNAQGQAEDGNDVVTFVRRDGTVLAVEVRTMPGGASAHNVDTGELLLERLAVHAKEELAEWIGYCLDDAERMSPRP